MTPIKNIIIIYNIYITLSKQVVNFISMPFNKKGVLYLQ